MCLFFAFFFVFLSGFFFCFGGACRSSGCDSVLCLFWEEHEKEEEEEVVVVVVLSLGFCRSAFCCEKSVSLVSGGAMRAARFVSWRMNCSLSL